jgi:hypothetical protein
MTSADRALSNLLSAPALRPSTRFVLGAGGDYQELIQTDELVTVDRPWEITLDLPAVDPAPRSDSCGGPAGQLNG